MFLLIPNISWAENAATIFNNRCAACHGNDGLAALSVAKKQNVPSFADAKVQRAANAELEEVILSGGKQKKSSHAWASKGITKQEAAELAIYVKQLGKKKS